MLQIGIDILFASPCGVIRPFVISVQSEPNISGFDISRQAEVNAQLETRNERLVEIYPKGMTIKEKAAKWTGKH